MLYHKQSRPRESVGNVVESDGISDSRDKKREQTGATKLNPQEIGYETAGSTLDAPTPNNSDSAFLEWQVSEKRTSMIHFSALKPPKAPVPWGHRVFQHSRLIKCAEVYSGSKLLDAWWMEMWYYESENDRDWNSTDTVQYASALDYWVTKHHIPLNLQLMTIRPERWEPAPHSNAFKRCRDADSNQGIVTAAQAQTNKKRSTSQQV